MGPPKHEEELPSSFVVSAGSGRPLLLLCRSVQRRLLRSPDHVFLLGGLRVVVVVVAPLGHVRGGRRLGGTIGAEVREGVRALALLRPVGPAAFQARGETGEDADASDMVTLSGLVYIDGGWEMRGDRRESTERESE